MADDIRLILGVDDRDLIRSQKEQKKFERNLLTIEATYRKGDITAKRYNAELSKQARELQKLGGSYNKASSEIRKFAYQLRTADDATLASAQSYAFAGKNINRMGMRLQQAGYQVGDFAVQVQGGTNAAVALGQQGAQLLGIFGPAGAIAGAALAITTALVAPLMKANKEAKDLIAKGTELAESYKDKLDAIKFGVNNEVEIEAAQKLFDLQKTDRDLREKLRNTDNLRARQRIAEEIKSHRLLLGPARELSKELKSRREQYEVVKALSGSETQEAQNLLEITRNANRERLESAEKARKATEEAKEQLRIQNQAIHLQAYEKKFGKDSLEYKREAGAIERENLVLKMKAAGVDQEIVDKMVAGNLRLEVGRELLAKQVQEAKELKEQLAIISKMDFPNLSIAQGAYASQLAMYGGQTGPKGPTETTTEPNKTGGKTDKEKLAEYLQGKQQELRLEESLVGIFGAERDIKSELFEVEQKYGKLIDTTQDSQLAGTLRQIEAEKERHAVIEEAKAQQEALAEVIDSSMGDAFMSIIDGTMSVKDAFKSMAAEIIKELYRILVVKQMVNAVTSFLPFADGGAFSGGSQIQAYADGGVVGGPTTFPMAGGKTGLMGEAGPEAIMPLKRGANGKLGVQMEGGGGDTINVVQNFSFQANGDDSVKKIIAQAAPQIAQMTKSSLLNDRRRGGATKAAFG